MWRFSVDLAFRAAVTKRLYTASTAAASTETMATVTKISTRVKALFRDAGWEDFMGLNRGYF